LVIKGPVPFLCNLGMVGSTKLKSLVVYETKHEISVFDYWPLILASTELEFLVLPTQSSLNVKKLLQ
jgi:hypothetical protein